MSLLGIARKSGAIIVGSKACEEAIVRQKAQLIVLCNDAGNSTKRNFNHLAEKFSVEIVTFPYKKELGMLVGFREAAVLVVTNENFVKSVKETVNSGGE